MGLDVVVGVGWWCWADYDDASGTVSFKVAVAGLVMAIESADSVTLCLISFMGLFAIVMVF